MLDSLAAKRIGAALLALIWHGSADPSEYLADHEGHVWFVTFIGSEVDRKPGRDASIEPWQIALNAETGAPVGGSTLGLARKGLLHRVYHAVTSNGVNATSPLDELWPKIVGRAVRAKSDRSPAMIVVEEMLGPKWTVSLSGQATGGGKTVLLQAQDALFLRRLASIRPPK